MKQRKGMGYRLLDGERFTIAIGGNYKADGSHRRPLIDIIDRQRQYGHPLHRITIPLPHVRFYRCYRLRRFGGLAWYRVWHKGMRWLCSNPHSSLRT